MKKQCLMLLTIVFVLSACSSYNYYAVSNKPLTTQNYHTYAWIPEGQSKSTNIYNNDIATDRIVDAASKELENRGLKLDNANPDILVRYSAVVENQVKYYNEPIYYQPPYRLSPRVGYYRGRAYRYYSYFDPMPIYLGYEARKIKIKEGSIIIDLIDRKTKKVIWRGWAEGEVTNPENAINEIPIVVANIFKKLT